MQLVDSHAHLDLLDDPRQAISDCRQAGVDRLIAVGIDLASSRMAAGFAGQFPEVVAAIGIHPHDAAAVDDDAISELEAIAIANPGQVVAIGETGLDYYRDRAPKDSQQAALIRHIDLARKTALPLIIHSREAGDDILALLGEHAGGLTVILHCFALFGKEKECAERGYYMSVAGNVTFAKATELREAATRIPANLLLTETDSPYLSPVPKRGKPNAPENVRFVLEEVAALRGDDPAELARLVHENFQTAFAPAAGSFQP